MIGAAGSTRAETLKTTGSSGKDNDSLGKMTNSTFISKAITCVKLGRLYNRDGQARVFGRQLTAGANRAQTREKTPWRRVSQG